MWSSGGGEKVEAGRVVMRGLVEWMKIFGIWQSLSFAIKVPRL